MPPVKRAKQISLPSLQELGLHYHTNQHLSYQDINWYDHHHLDNLSQTSLSLTLPSELNHTNQTHSDGDTSTTLTSSEMNSNESNDRVELKPIHTKRNRRKYHEMNRIYTCIHPNCNKAYSVLNHLNTHIKIQNHGRLRVHEEFPKKR